MKTFVAAILLLSVAAVYGDRAGGIHDVDVNDRWVVKAAETATATISEWKNSVNHQQLLVIKSAKAQVVSGLLYYLEIEIQDSGCPKSAPLEGCNAEPLERYEVCNIKVLEQPWLEVLKVVGDIRCRPSYHA